MHEKTEFRTRDRWLLFGFALGPMAVLTHLTVSYALVPESCAQNSKTLLHASTAIFFVLTLVATYIGTHYYRAFANAEGELWKERTRWLSLVVIVLSVFSAIVIIAMELSNLILRSCD